MSDMSSTWATSAWTRTRSTLGPWLQCDAARECIQDNPKANELVRGSYRQPFAVPEITV